jgi:hypothetical protein
VRASRSRISVFSLLAASCMSFSALADEPKAGFTWFGPKSTARQTIIDCEHTSYVLEYKADLKIKGVQLKTIQQMPGTISDKVVQQLSAEFAKFNDITFLRAGCGVERNGLPAEFLVLEIRGSYIVPIKQARDICNKKGWHFDRMTRRTFVVDESEFDVSGKNIGYCSVNAGSFSMKIPLVKDENE